MNSLWLAYRTGWLMCLLALTGALQLWGQAAPSTPAPAPRPAENRRVAPATPPTADEAAAAVIRTPQTDAQPTAAPVDPNGYKIGPLDILMVRVWRENELTGQVQVRPDGKITLNLIGDVEAAGLTPRELTDKITQAYSEIINKPEIMVQVQSVQSRRYYVTGEVNRPGTYPLVIPVRILEALTNAGGFRDFADTKKIRILRNGKTLKFNYNDVSKGKNMDQNVEIQNGDFIVVP